MWKQRNTEALPVSPILEPWRPAPIIPSVEPKACTVDSASHQSTISKGIHLVGKITGAESLESLYIEGCIEGDINLPATRVTVSSDGHVTASIIARDIVVMGKIHGNLTASGSVDIRATGFVTGVVSAPRISIEDGAFLKGRLDVRNSGTEPAVHIDLPKQVLETPKTFFVRPKIENRHVQPDLQLA
jgi:cytoskeletal protein CcmA (bactofilin family)